MASWLVFALFVGAALLFRSSGDVWLVAITKLAVLTVLSLIVAVAIAAALSWAA
jgi:hypothetical protein